jgi:phosphonopyruvate decarboxylase
MISAGEFVDHLLARGFDFFTGVPCSLVKGVLAELSRRGRFVVENREDAALGLAAGAYLGGRLPVVISQSSGVGVALNALTSLHMLYRIPTLLLITWRGYAGHDAPEHVIWGPVLPQVLTDTGIPHQELLAAEVCAQVDWAVAEMRARPGPVALLSRDGVLP